jgi:MoxR-like ATPase
VAAPDNTLADWRHRAQRFEKEVGKAVIGLDDAIHKITLALFARGHILLEGQAGTGKTTLLRAVAHCLGGQYARIEGSVDLLPQDLLYHAQIDGNGKPRIEPGPLLQHGEDLSVFFFNEINRARPQIHAVLLRIMAERQTRAFNREWLFPYLQVFADRNALERDETFEIPIAARDRFLMEIAIETSHVREIQAELIFNTRYHNTDSLICQLATGILCYTELPAIAESIQNHMHASDHIQQYALELWQATHHPEKFGIILSDTGLEKPLSTGLSARGMSQLLKAARVHAWLQERNYLTPGDIRHVFHDAAIHRMDLHPALELQKAQLLPRIIKKIVNTIVSP